MLPSTKALPDRDRLILEHYGIVRAIAGRLARRLPPTVELSELIQEGSVGLLEAANAFEPSRGVPFKAFAELRIRGRMLDYLRAMAPTTRSTRGRMRELEAARTELRASLGREPDRLQMATHLGVTPEEYDAWVLEAQPRTIVSAETPLDADEGTMSLLDSLVDPVANDSERDVDHAQRRDLVIKAIDRLPARERDVVTLYHLRGIQLKDIGRQMGVTEARVCQILASGVRILEKRLSAADLTPGERRAGESV